MKTQTKAYLALTVVCILWGTTYLAIKIGVATIPPFLFTGLRQTAAGLILWLLIPFLKINVKLTVKDIVKQIPAGLLLIVLGNATLGWAEKYIPSGLAALIVSAMPLYVTLIHFLIGKRGELNSKIVTGLVLGSIGIILIFKDNLADLANSNYFWGIIVVFFSALCWAAGTVYMKENTFRTGSFVNSAIHFTSSGIVLLIISPLIEDYSQLNSISSASIWSLVYLIVFGSIITYMCYLYAVEHLQVGLVSIYAYINPFIAILLGMFVLQERVTWVTLLAFITTLSGVYFINRGHSLNKKKLAGKGPEGVERLGAA